MEKITTGGDPSASDESRKSCKATHFLAYLTTFLLILVNIFIAYLMLEYFKKDGFSVSGGLFIGAFYIFTIPANIFSGYMIKKAKTGRKPAPLFFLVLGLATTMTGILLQNAIPLWIYIFLYGLVLTAASVVCMISRKGLPI